MYSHEEVIKRFAEPALIGSAAMCVAGLAAGTLFSGVACGPDLSEWNLVNGALCGALAASINFSLKQYPKGFQNASRISQGGMSVSDIKSEGSVPGAVSFGLAAIPVILLIWTVKGFFGMGIGVCAEASPIFYSFSLLEMVAEVSAILYVLCENMKASGYDFERVKGIAKGYAISAKDKAADWSLHGGEYAKQYSEKAIPTLKAGTDWTTSNIKWLWDNRPKYCTAEFWTGPEAQALLP